jgi:hypothetical protein
MWADMTGGFEIVCECEYERCAEMFTVATRDYEEMRRDPAQFAVIRGHELADVDLILEHRDGYDLVRKRSRRRRARRDSDGPA